MIGERRCIVAPNKHHYVYCPSCGKGSIKESWRFLYCSENCKGIYQICDDFVNEKITGTEANAKLKNFDLSDLADFHAGIQQNIADIYASVSTDDKKESEDKAEGESEKKKKSKII